VECKASVRSVPQNVGYRKGGSKTVRRDDVSTSSPNSCFALSLLDLQQKKLNDALISENHVSRSYDLWLEENKEFRGE